MKKTLILIMSLLSICSYILVSSCNKDKTKLTNELTCDGIDGSNNTYNTRIKSILDNNCATAGCHDAATASATVILDNYVSSKDALNNKNVLCAINYETSCSPMPPTTKLNDTLINYINCWKQSGFPL